MSQARDAGSARPRVSVVVLSFNRREILRRGLESVRKQDVPGCELIVVDNASSDGSPDMVRERFPEARLIALDRNEAIKGRNIGFRAARAELVLSLDDDIELSDPASLRRLCERMEASPDVGAVTLKICEEQTGSDSVEAHWWHPLPRAQFQDRELLTDHINEAAVLFRAEALDRVGHYDEALFWGGEEWDLCLRLLDAGYRILYHPEPVLHLAPRGLLNAQADPRHALLIRNRCSIALRRLPLPSALAFVAPRLALWGWRALRHGYVRYYLEGVVALLRMAPSILRERSPVSPRTHRMLRAIRRQTPSAPLI